jgi:hypothetical protein
MLGMRLPPGTAPSNATRPTPKIVNKEESSLDHSEMLKVLDLAKAQARKRSRKNVKKAKSISSSENLLVYGA